MSAYKSQRSKKEPPWNSSFQWLQDRAQHCCLIEIKQTQEVSFTHPGDTPIISTRPERKHFQWNSAIKKLRSHVNCFLYFGKTKDS